jgi:rubredoxin-NAD+ reductase
MLGTRWNDISDNGTCPECGVGKEGFDMIESGPEADSSHAEQAPVPIVIVGTGLAGYGVAKEFRKLDQDTPLLLISHDDGNAYSKPMLSTGYTKNTDAAGLVQASADAMAAQLNATVLTQTQVMRIDPQKQQLQLEGNKNPISFSKLVLALGADPITPPLEGDALDQVFSINNLQDFAHFRQQMKDRQAKRICVIGGGLIGCEYTNDLLNGGFDVATVDPLAFCLPTLLPEVAGKAVQRALEAKGAKFYFGSLVTRVDTSTEGGVQACLNTGEKIDVDIVVCAVGVRPSIQLAQQSGIEINRGIVTDRLLQTSADNVYALGDCAEVDGHSLVYVAPLMAAARALAKTLTGEATAVKYGVMPVTVKTPACPVVVSPVPTDAKGEWHIQEEGNNVIAEFRNPKGELIGMALTGEGTKKRMGLQKQLPPIMT